MCDFGKQTLRIQFLALHGCRYGEAVALLDADIYDGLVHISKSAAGETKTVVGNRVVPPPSPRGVTVHSLRNTYAHTLKNTLLDITQRTYIEFIVYTNCKYRLLIIS